MSYVIEVNFTTADLPPVGANIEVADPNGNVFMGRVKSVDQETRTATILVGDLKYREKNLSPKHQAWLDEHRNPGSNN